MPTKTAISFGLVHIPVSLHTATVDNDMHFNQLRAGSTDRVRYKKTCEGCDHELSPSEIVRGYEYERGKYVVVTDDELERIKSVKDRTLRILHFAGPDEISPVYFSKPYHMTPQAGGEKAFELLRRAMADTGRFAVARTVLGTSDTLMALMPLDGGMTAQTLLYAQDLRESPQGYARPEPSDAELAMASQLITAMVAPFDAAAHRNEYQIRLRELIESKIAGVERPAQKEEHQNEVADLMEALRLSVEGRTAPKNTTKSEPKPKRAAALRKSSSDSVSTRP